MRKRKTRPNGHRNALIKGHSEIHCIPMCILSIAVHSYKHPREQMHSSGHSTCFFLAHLLLCVPLANHNHAIYSLLIWGHMHPYSHGLVWRNHMFTWKQSLVVESMSHGLVGNHSIPVMGADRLGCLQAYFRVPRLQVSAWSWKWIKNFLWIPALDFSAASFLSFLPPLTHSAGFPPTFFKFLASSTGINQRL